MVWPFVMNGLIFIITGLCDWRESILSSSLINQTNERASDYREWCLSEFHSTLRVLIMGIINLLHCLLELFFLALPFKL